MPLTVDGAAHGLTTRAPAMATTVVTKRENPAYRRPKLRGAISLTEWNNHTMQHPNSSTTSGNVPLSDVDLENLHVSRENHMRHAADIGAWAVMGSVETTMCRRCRSDLHQLVDKALWDVIASAAEGALNSAADLDAAMMRISNAVMDAVWDEHRKLEGRWRTEGVRKRYDPPAMPKLIPFGGWHPEPDCAESIPCYMRVEVTK